MLLSTKPGVQKSAAWILGQVWLQLEGTATDAEGTGGSPNRAWGLGKDPPPLQVPIQILASCQLCLHPVPSLGLNAGLEPLAGASGAPGLLVWGDTGLEGEAAEKLHLA